MTTIEALRLKIDNLQVESQQFKSQGLKLQLERDQYKEENEQLKIIYEELLKKMEEGDALASEKGDQTTQIATLERQLETQLINESQLQSKCKQLEGDLDSWKINCNTLEKEVNALAYLKIYSEKLEKDIESWRLKCVDLQQRVTQLENSMELECFRAVDRERKQWESREERLVQQLSELQQQLAPAGLLSGVKGQVTKQTQAGEVKQPQNTQLSPLEQDIKPRVDERIGIGVAFGQQQLPQLGQDARPRVTERTVAERYDGQSCLNFKSQSQNPLENIRSTGKTEDGHHCASVVNETNLAQFHNEKAADYQQSLPVEMTRGFVDNILPVCGESIPSVLMAQQLPPLSKFSGERNDGDMDTFQEWIEQFEMIASICGWSVQAKLVNLVTRLRGQAYAFFRSCSIQIKTSYALLVAELHKRFTPVHLQAVQSSLFHDRKQKSGEPVDEYAQDLRVLFYRAYPYVQQGTQEAEKFGQMVLTNQFVTGLRGDIKMKVVGVEGSFDQILTRARFEEAKLRDLSNNETGPSTKSLSMQGRREVTEDLGSTNVNSKQQKVTTPRFNVGGQRMSGRCFNCGSSTHLIRQCPYVTRPRATGTSGAGQPTNRGCVSSVTPSGESGENHQKITECKNEVGSDKESQRIGVGE